MKSKAKFNPFDSKLTKKSNPPESFDAQLLPPRPQTSLPTRSNLSDLLSNSGTLIRRYSHESPAILVSSNPNISRDVKNESLLRIMTKLDNRDKDMLISMSEKGDLPGVQRLIKYGINLSQCIGLNGFTALHHASNRGHGAIISELLRGGLDINTRNDAGETPLHLACYSGILLNVEQLIDKGANINAQNNDRETPLFYAARRSMTAVVRLLLQRNANPTIKDNFDEVAEDHASDTRTKLAFSTSTNLVEALGSLTYDTVLIVFHFLSAKDIGAAACVSSKWHRVSESPTIWSKLGRRRWENSLQSSLGFAPLASACFRPKPLSKDKNNKLKTKSSLDLEASVEKISINCNDSNSSGTNANIRRSPPKNFRNCHSR